MLGRQCSSNLGFSVVVVVPTPISPRSRRHHRRATSSIILWSSSSLPFPPPSLFHGARRSAVFYLSTYGRYASVLHVECITAHCTQSILTSFTPNSRPRDTHAPHGKTVYAMALTKAMGT